MKPKLKEFVWRAFSCAGLMRPVRSLFAGPAAIVMFHEVQRDFQTELETGVSVSLFEYSLGWLRREGWKIVTLEECVERVLNGDRSERFAVLTFDDGYRDNVTVALPILERYNAPFVMYVPTGSTTRTLPAWWLGLRELIRSRDDVAIDAMDIRVRCPDHRSKVSALTQATAWVHEDYSRAEMLAPTFHKAGISVTALNEEYFLDEGDIVTLSRHRLASIGGHTTSHPALKNLDRSLALAEIGDNRSYLQNILQKPVRHFSYPYGNPRAVGAREEGLVRDAGYSTAVTTRPVHLDMTNLNSLALPRVFVDSEFGFQARMNGLQQAFHRLRGDDQADW